MNARITFCGGAGTVTGANFLLDTGSQKFLIDCGAREREKTCDIENLKAFPYEPKSIAALFVTHAHQDHIGRIPKLVHDGFAGKIYSTPATRELSAVMFDDALTVMTEETKRHGCAPLYDKEDVERTMLLWHTHVYHQPFQVDDVTVEFLDAGHILGSALVQLTRDGRSIVFTGDLGNPPEPLLRDTESPKDPEYIVMESVYGDRVHEDRTNRREILLQAIEETRAKGGTLLIPSFSLERTQALLFELNELISEKQMMPIPVYLDSPLAERVTAVFGRHLDDLNEAARALSAQGPLFSFPSLSITHHVGDSRNIHAKPDPKVIIAGAGMSAGGRIRAHETQYLGDPHASVLFVGYQAPGSLGRRIQDGATKVTIDGADVTVRAAIHTLSGYSGHADRDQLLSFVERCGDSLKKAFVVMGEPRASLFLAQRVKDFLDVDAVVPAAGESVLLEW